MSGHPSQAADTIGRNIRIRRIAMGFTQAEFAGIIGVSRSTVVRHETGRHMPTGGTLAALAAVFDCTISELFEPASIIGLVDSADSRNDTPETRTA